MHIVYVSYSSTPGKNASSLQIVKTCEAFSFNNFKTTLVLPNTPQSNLSIFNYYNVKNKFILKRFNFFNRFPQGINFYLYSVCCLFYILSLNNTLVISRNFFLIFLLSIFKKKCIIELHHDVKIEGIFSQLLLKVFKFLNYSSVVKIVAISNQIKHFYCERYKIIKKKIIVLASGSSIDKNLNIKFIKKKKLNIGYFGSLSNSKGIDTIVKLSKIDHQNNYHIYGGTNHEVRFLNRKKINKNLKINSYLPYKHVETEMIKMDILLMPYKKIVKSLGEIDDIANFTSPLKLFDYLACGKIIICSNLKVFKEILNTKNCFFVKNFENIYEWKQKISFVMNSSSVAFIMKKNNYIYSKKFNHKKRVLNYLS